MVGLVDTHAHVFVDEFEDKTAILKSAKDCNVDWVLMPNIDADSIVNIKNTNQQFETQTKVMMGLHPSSVAANYIETLALIKTELDAYPCCAVGEIGLDFYWSDEFKKEQLKALEIQLQWAIDKSLPVSLHTRNATQETIEICKNYQSLKGVFHCFGGSVEEAHQIIDLGMYLGIGGVLTFKNSGLADVIEQIDLKHLVLETDSPYLAPHPKRGKRNEPSYLRIIAEKLAEIKRVSLEEVSEQTSENASQIFKLY